MKTKPAFIGIRVSAKLRSDLDRIAKKSSRDLTDIIAQAIQIYLDQSGNKPCTKTKRKNSSS